MTKEELFKKIKTDGYELQGNFGDDPDARRTALNKVEAPFKKDLFEAFDVERNAKREKLFSLAWNYGHSGGYMEVALYFEEMLELIW